MNLPYSKVHTYVLNEFLTADHSCAMVCIVKRFWNFDFGNYFVIEKMVSWNHSNLEYALIIIKDFSTFYFPKLPKLTNKGKVDWYKVSLKRKTLFFLAKPSCLQKVQYLWPFMQKGSKKAESIELCFFSLKKKWDKLVHTPYNITGWSLKITRDLMQNVPMQNQTHHFRNTLLPLKYLQYEMDCHHI